MATPNGNEADKTEEHYYSSKNVHSPEESHLKVNNGLLESSPEEHKNRTQEQTQEDRDETVDGGHHGGAVSTDKANGTKTPGLRNDAENDDNDRDARQSPQGCNIDSNVSRSTVSTENDSKNMERLGCQDDKDLNKGSPHGIGEDMFPGSSGNMDDRGKHSAIDQEEGNTSSKTATKPAHDTDAKEDLFTKFEDIRASDLQEEDPVKPETLASRESESVLNDPLTQNDTHLERHSEEDRGMNIESPLTRQLFHELPTSADGEVIVETRGEGGDDGDDGENKSFREVRNEGSLPVQSCSSVPEAGCADCNEDDDADILFPKVTDEMESPLPSPSSAPQGAGHLLDLDPSLERIDPVDRSFQHFPNVDPDETADLYSFSDDDDVVYTDPRDQNFEYQPRDVYADDFEGSFNGYDIASLWQERSGPTSPIPSPDIETGPPAAVLDSSQTLGDENQSMGLGEDVPEPVSAAPSVEVAWGVNLVFSVLRRLVGWWRLITVLYALFIVFPWSIFMTAFPGLERVEWSRHLTGLVVSTSDVLKSDVRAGFARLVDSPGHSVSVVGFWVLIVVKTYFRMLWLVFSALEAKIARVGWASTVPELSSWFRQRLLPGVLPYAASLVTQWCFGVLELVVLVYPWLKRSLSKCRSSARTLEDVISQTDWSDLFTAIRSTPRQALARFFHICSSKVSGRWLFLLSYLRQAWAKLKGLTMKPFSAEWTSYPSMLSARVKTLSFHAVEMLRTANPQEWFLLAGKTVTSVSLGNWYRTFNCFWKKAPETSTPDTAEGDHLNWQDCLSRVWLWLKYPASRISQVEFRRNRSIILSRLRESTYGISQINITSYTSMVWVWVRVPCLTPSWIGLKSYVLSRRIPVKSLTEWITRVSYLPFVRIEAVLSQIDWTGCLSAPWKRLKVAWTKARRCDWSTAPARIWAWFVQIVPEVVLKLRSAVDTIKNSSWPTYPSRFGSYCTHLLNQTLSSLSSTALRLKIHGWSTYPFITCASCVQLPRQVVYAFRSTLETLKGRQWPTPASNAWDAYAYATRNILSRLRPVFEDLRSYYWTFPLLLSQHLLAQLRVRLPVLFHEANRLLVMHIASCSAWLKKVRRRINKKEARDVLESFLPEKGRRWVAAAEAVCAVSILIYIHWVEWHIDHPPLNAGYWLGLPSMQTMRMRASMIQVARANGTEMEWGYP